MPRPFETALADVLVRRQARRRAKGANEVERRQPRTPCQRRNGQLLRIVPTPSLAGTPTPLRSRGSLAVARSRRITRARDRAARYSETRGRAASGRASTSA
jgi:hypothetical protein